MRIFIAGLGTETNTFSPIPTSRASFEEHFFWLPGQLPRELVSSIGPLNAAHERRDAESLCIVEGTFASAAPSASLAQADYEALRDALLRDLEAALPVDAVLLDLHGAMVAEQCLDCEGDLLKRVRDKVGPTTVVGAELDPHAQLSEQMCVHADLLVMYKEYPHTDVLERGRELLDLALRTARGEIRPKIHRYDCRMIGLYHTNREPMKGFVSRMTSLEKEPGVLTVSLAHGFPWGDVPDMSTQVIVTTDDNVRQDGAALARSLGEELFELRGHTSDSHVDAARAVELVRKAPYGLVVVADSADNPGAGAPGDATHLLRAFLDSGISTLAAGVIYDPGAVALASKAGVGRRLSLRIGGKMCAASGQPLDLDVQVAAIDRDAWQSFAGAKGPLGTVVTLVADGMALLISDRRAQCYDAGVFERAGVDLSLCRVVLVKSMQHFRASFEPLANRVILTTTPGTHPFDLKSIAYLRVRRPLWPLDQS